jgi:hypothetical protein
MSIDADLVFKRTEPGAQEVYEKTRSLSQAERLVLILVDGRLSVAGLSTRLPSVGADRIEEALERLVELELVEARGRRAPAVAPRPAAPVAPDRLAVETALQVVEAELAQAEAAAKAEVDTGAANVSNGDGVSKRSLDSIAETRGRPVPEVARPTGLGLPGDSLAAPSTVVTQFAITSVNVPDALDLQEERDKAEWADALAAKHGERRKRWLGRGGVAAGVVAAVAVLLGLWQPMPEATTPQAVAARLTEALGLPVTVHSTDLDLLPAPHLNLSGIEVAGRTRIEEVRVGINWSEVWNGLNSGDWTWGEARVAPLELSAPQALELAQGLLRAGDRLPAKVSTVRFESVRFPGSALLPGSYEVVARRGADGRFGRLRMSELGLGEGSVELALAPGEPHTRFDLVAARWALPFGPRVAWNEMRASGTLEPDAVRVAAYSLGGFYGVTTGTVSAQRQGTEWLVAGVVEPTNLDVEAILSISGAKRSGAAAGDRAAPIQGTLTGRWQAAGRGNSLEAAIAATTLTGPFQVRWAALNGVNLGAVAAQGEKKGGVTRFTEFGGVLIADRHNLTFQGVDGRAGAMRARGDFSVAPDGALRGFIRVDLGVAVSQAPATLRLSGAVAKPQFGF